MLVAWTPLSPSRRERSLRRLAQLVALVAALGLLWASLRDASVEPVPLLAGLIAAIAGAMAWRGTGGPRLEVGVEDSGALVVRPVAEAGGRVEQGVRCVFATSWLITLRRGTIWVSIWPDSVPRDAFRRFWVHLRWNPGRQPAEGTAATAPGREG